MRKIKIKIDNEIIEFSGFYSSITYLIDKCRKLGGKVAYNIMDISEPPEPVSGWEKLKKVCNPTSDSFCHVNDIFMCHENYCPLWYLHGKILKEVKK